MSKYVAIESYKNPSYNRVIFFGSLKECKEAAEQHAIDDDVDDGFGVEWEWDNGERIYWYGDGDWEPACITVLSV